MEKQLESVVDDISIIKSVIEKTRRSFVGFSKIFIIWGCMYIAMSLLSFVQNMNIEATMTFYNNVPLLVYLVPAVFFGIGGLVYFSVVRKQPLIGLERHLMTMWILVIFAQLIRMSIEIPMDADTSTMVVKTSNFAFVSYVLGIGLIMTGILTELKNFKFIGGVYILLALVHSYAPSFVGGLSITRAMDSLGYVIMPFTLLYVGVYLRRQSERG